ncbi:hypothetical protein TTHERM_000411589 (macronuclear) [Tetrahymena thermophila SB210]|uniref:Uncharacterized protein n=1 Tax=Tetrahymena thermophila (strain SB210) TaxID=312017 RepID=W7X1T5_TETTS|nr:hypothetical protein TTHERM_000411589 [Tetrahymena thermophila SB210]EWS73200.1 hypothetical protein TTHERM_000411589 [Tetrahymena thermophila SB210]|eukprot:XP_012654276.1 hypothetical protein TTHERM_000411589 [Tetrahymena thermophila SB210]
MQQRLIVKYRLSQYMLIFQFALVCVKIQKKKERKKSQTHIQYIIYIYIHIKHSQVKLKKQKTNRKKYKQKRKRHKYINFNQQYSSKKNQSIKQKNNRLSNQKKKVILLILTIKEIKKQDKQLIKQQLGNQIKKIETKRYQILKILILLEAKLLSPEIFKNFQIQAYQFNKNNNKKKFKNHVRLNSKQIQFYYILLRILGQNQKN